MDKGASAGPTYFDRTSGNALDAVRVRDWLVFPLDGAIRRGQRDRLAALSAVFAGQPLGRRPRHHPPGPGDSQLPRQQLAAPRRHAAVGRDGAPPLHLQEEDHHRRHHVGVVRRGGSRAFPDTFSTAALGGPSRFPTAGAQPSGSYAPVSDSGPSPPAVQVSQPIRRPRDLDTSICARTTARSTLACGSRTVCCPGADFGPSCFSAARGWASAPGGYESASLSARRACVTGKLIDQPSAPRCIWPRRHRPRARW